MVFKLYHRIAELLCFVGHIDWFLLKACQEGLLQGHYVRPNVVAASSRFAGSSVRSEMNNDTD